MSAGRTVRVDIIGDSKSAAAAFGSADKAAGGFSDKLAKFAVVGAVGFAAAEKLGGSLLKMAQGAADDQQNVAKLQTTLQSIGTTWDGHTGKINEAIAASQKLGFTDDSTRNSLSLLVQQTGSADEAMSRLSIAQDLARGTGMDLEQASKLVGKVTDENTEVLKRYGISLGEGATEAEALQAIQAKFGGQSAAWADTAAGKMAILRDRFSELQESIGQKVLPILLTLTTILLDKVMPAAEKLTNWLSGPLTRAFNSVVNFIKGPVKQAFDLLGQAFTRVKTAFDNAGIGAALNTLEWIAISAAQAVLHAFLDIDWIGELKTVGGYILDGIVAGFNAAVGFGGRVAGWIAEQISSVDWGGAASGAGAAILDGIVAGWDAVTGFGGRFVDWFVGQVTAIDYKGTGAAVLDGIVAGFQAVTNFGERFVDWFVGVVTGVEWGDLASTILDKLVAAFWTVEGWGASFVAYVSDAVTSVPWDDAAAGILSKITTAFNAVKGWGESFVAWMSTTLGSVDWKAVGETIGAKVIEAVKLIKTFGQEAIDWIRQQLEDGDWSQVTKTITEKLNEALGGDEDKQAPILKLLQPIFDLMKGEWGQILDNFTLAWANLNAILEDLTGIVLPEGTLTTGLKIVAGAIGALITVVALQQILDFTGHIREATDAIAFLTSVMLIIVDFITRDWLTTWDNAKAKIQSVWDFTTGIPGIVKTGIDGVVNTISGALTGLRDNVWNPIWNGFLTTVTTVVNAIKTIVNGVVSGVNTAIRAINAATSFTISIPHNKLTDFVGIGGASWSFAGTQIGYINSPFAGSGGTGPKAALFNLGGGGGPGGGNQRPPVDLPGNMAPPLGGFGSLVPGAGPAIPPNPLAGLGNLSSGGLPSGGGGSGRTAAYLTAQGAGKLYNNTPQGTQPDSLGRLPGNPCWGKMASCEALLGLDASTNPSLTYQGGSYTGQGGGNYIPGSAGAYAYAARTGGVVLSGSGLVGYPALSSGGGGGGGGGGSQRDPWDTPAARLREAQEAAARLGGRYMMDKYGLYVNEGTQAWDDYMRTGHYGPGHGNAGGNVFLDGHKVGRFLGHRYKRESFSLRDPAGSCP